MGSLWCLQCSYSGTRWWTSATTTTFSPSLRPTSHLMAVTSSPTAQLVDSATASWLLISLVKKTDVNICQHTVCLYLIFDRNKCFLPTKNMHAHRKNSFCKPNFSRSELSNLSNGHFVAVAAENIGFTSYPPAYLSKKAKGNNLLIGANFASASSGYYDATAELYVSCTIYFIYSWSVQ